MKGDIKKLILRATMLAMGAFGTISSSFGFVLNTCPSNLDLTRISFFDSAQLYVLQDGWRRANSPGLKWKPGQHRRFLYVIRSPDERTGALVIKSGRRLLPNETETNKKQVQLIREGYISGRLDRGKLCVSSNIGQGWSGHVASKDYDLYHSYLITADPGALHKLRDLFHVSYFSSIDGQCFRTDNNKQFLDSTTRLWSYSFDQKIVGSGVPSQSAFFHFMPHVVDKAEAGVPNQSPGYLLLKSETRIFHTGDKGLACIPFDRPVSGTGDFIRIKDLEGHFMNGKFWGEDSYQN